MPYVWSGFPPRLVYFLWDTDIPNKNREASNSLISETLAYVEGKMFDRWIDDTSGSARSNGYSENELINNPAYQIEDILRSYIFAERDLTTTTVTDTTHIIIDGLKNSANDWYNYAIYYNITNDHKTYITDYVGSTKTLILASADVNATVGDNIVITNIQGDNRISVTAFDLVGNSTNGKRDGWIFGRSINRMESASQTISQLAMESNCILFQSYNQYKLVALDAATSADTWLKPLKTEGREFFDIKLTSLQNVFSTFRLRYAYSYSQGDYTKEFYVDKNGYTSGGTVISATEKTLCENAETNYRIKNNFEYSSDWIYDLTTAEYLLQKLVNWFTKQRMIVTWTTGLHDSTFDYIKYELGDQVKLNNSRILPTGVNNSSYFMIMSKQIMPYPGAPFITWQLMEMS